MNKTFYWKVWLRPNQLTKEEDNDYVAEVSTTGKTLRNADLARLIVESGSEISEETILSILNRRDGLVLGKLQEGYSVQDGVSHIAPRVYGNWTGAVPKYDPKAHRIGLDMIETAETRDALSHIGLEVLGIRDAGAYIGLVTDSATGHYDGVITPGDDIIIEGRKIRIAPDDDPGTGIYFTLDSLTDHAVYKVDHRLMQNDPKKIIARTPALQPGKYTLTIVTRFSSGNHLLNEARTLTYASPLTVKP
ncbi:MAG: DUF4469 domain-containing protein [Tannerella sp.]|jgi:hypothetical protein|nr:DUF4469 domain-containing protein [Tannerella sp.]